MTDENKILSPEEKLKQLIVAINLADEKRNKLETMNSGLERSLFDSLAEIITKRADKLSKIGAKGFKFDVEVIGDHIEISTSAYRLAVTIKLSESYLSPGHRSTYNNSSIAVLHTGSEKKLSYQLYLDIDDNLKPVWKSDKIISNDDLSDKIFNWFVDTYGEKALSTR